MERGEACAVPAAAQGAAGARGARVMYVYRRSAPPGRIRLGKRMHVEMYVVCGRSDRARRLGKRESGGGSHPFGAGIREAGEPRALE